MKCAQHAAQNPKFEKMELFRHKQIEGPAHMVEGGHHLRKDPNPHPLVDDRCSFGWWIPTLANRQSLGCFMICSVDLALCISNNPSVGISNPQTVMLGGISRSINNIFFYMAGSGSGASWCASWPPKADFRPFNSLISCNDQYWKLPPTSEISSHDMLPIYVRYRLIVVLSFFVNITVTS